MMGGNSLPFRKIPTAALTLWRTFGCRGMIRRGLHEFCRALGWYPVAPRRRLAGTGDPLRAFVPDLSALGDAAPLDLALDRGARVVSGEFLAFGWRWDPLPAAPDAWVTHPSSGQPLGGPPWWALELYAPAGADIKLLWEPARFGWVYDLIRAYAVQPDDRYPAAFARHFRSWIASSPPFRGPHWACGQETAIRGIALLWAEGWLSRIGKQYEPMRGEVTEVLAVSGERIAAALGYALSQRNNHGISEATGLIALGSRFTGQHPEAAAWLARGHSALEESVLDQFAEDGWYAQHSFNYLRVALDQALIAQRVLEDQNLELSPEAVSRLIASVDVLLAVVEPSTGGMPDHGANDGALVHPLSTALCRDFRPLLTVAAATLRQPLPQNITPDAECLAWLSLEKPMAGPPMSGDGVVCGSSGWVAIRKGEVRVFLRAGRYRSRPGHIDALSITVSLAGRAIIVDPGTYSYNAPPPWRNGLVGSEVHNGPQRHDRPLGVRGPRFLWLLWPSARVVTVHQDRDSVIVEAEVPSYCVRRVVVTADRVRVEDRPVGGPADVTVRWLLHPGVSEEMVRAPESQVTEAEEGSIHGWYSPHYDLRIKSRSIRITRIADEHHPIVTEIGPLEVRDLDGAPPDGGLW